MVISSFISKESLKHLFCCLCCLNISNKLAILFDQLVAVVLLLSCPHASRDSLCVDFVSLYVQFFELLFSLQILLVHSVQLVNDLQFVFWVLFWLQPERHKLLQQLGTKALSCLPLNLLLLYLAVIPLAMAQFMHGAQLCVASILELKLNHIDQANTIQANCDKSLFLTHPLGLCYGVKGYVVIFTQYWRDSIVFNVKEIAIILTRFGIPTVDNNF